MKAIMVVIGALMMVATLVWMRLRRSDPPAGTRMLWALWRAIPSDDPYRGQDPQGETALRGGKEKATQ